MKERSATTITGVDSSLLPRDVNGDPLEPRNAPGYYPGFSTAFAKCVLG